MGMVFGNGGNGSYRGGSLDEEVAKGGGRDANGGGGRVAPIFPLPTNSLKHVACGAPADTRCVSQCKAVAGCFAERGTGFAWPITDVKHGAGIEVLRAIARADELQAAAPDPLALMSVLGEKLIKESIASTNARGIKRISQRARENRRTDALESARNPWPTP